MSRSFVLFTLATCALAYPQKVDITPHPKLTSLSANTNQELTSVSDTPSLELTSVSDTPSLEVTSASDTPSLKLTSVSDTPSLELASASDTPSLELASASDTPSLELASASDTPSLKLTSVSDTPSLELASVSEVPNPPPASVTVNPNYKPNEFELEQNRAAKYQFSTDIEDNINDLSHKRDETREGLNVKGSYSYSDGYYQRSVHYEADDKGYRVTKTEVTSLDGPHIDLTGTASVSNVAHGKRIAYKVQSVPLPGPVPKVLTEI